MAIQEPGVLMSMNYSPPLSVDLNTHHELKQSNLSTITKLNKSNPRYSLIFIIQNSLIPFIKIVKSRKTGIQIITLTAPYNLKIINSYLQHNINVREVTVTKLSKIIKGTNDHENLMILGDMNSIINQELDYFSPLNKKYQSKKFSVKDLLNLKMVDSYRVTNPTKKSFTRWNIIEKKMMKHILQHPELITFWYQNT